MFELDLASGALTTVTENPGDVVGWLPTADRMPAFTLEEGGDHVLSQWSHGERRQIARFSGTDFLFAAVLPRLAELSDGDLAHVSCDATAQRWVVDFTHDRDPGVTWSYDHSPAPPSAGSTTSPRRCC